LTPLHSVIGIAEPVGPVNISPVTSVIVNASSDTPGTAGTGFDSAPDATSTLLLLAIGLFGLVQVRRLSLPIGSTV
jgi:hypothetical protein